MNRFLAICLNCSILIVFVAVCNILLNQYVNKNIEQGIIEVTYNYRQENKTSLVPLNEKFKRTLDNVDHSTLLAQNFTNSATSKKQGSFVTADQRVIAMKKFLQDYHSPMAPYADVFIREADRTGLDWRLVASISGVESAFGELIPQNSNNGWGWRGGPGGAYSNFNTWGDGITTVTEGLAFGYGTHLTPSDIEPVYCPPCGQNPGHVWANGVTNYMNELDYYVQNLEKL